MLTRSLVRRCNFTGILEGPPGLFVMQPFLSPAELASVRANALSLHNKLRSSLHEQKQKEDNETSNNNIVTTNTYLSQHHNLTSKEFYRKVCILDDEDQDKQPNKQQKNNRKELTAQHFDQYGGPNHTLTYFIGSKNIPQFAKGTIVAKLIGKSEIVREILRRRRGSGNPKDDDADDAATVDQQKQKLIDSIVNQDWRFTFNTYASIVQQRQQKQKDDNLKKTSAFGSSSATPEEADENQQGLLLPGFAYHVDLPSNGEATAIFSLGAKSWFEIRKVHRDPDGKRNAQQTERADNKVFEVPLVDNSCVLLSGKSRWEWEHRVRPVPLAPNAKGLTSDDDETTSKIHRMSLVFGCQPKL